MQIHPKPHTNAIKQWVHLTHLLFSRTQGRLRMYLYMISTLVFPSQNPAHLYMYTWIPWYKLSKVRFILLIVGRNYVMIEDIS
jgi:hypothetical protein